MVALNVEGRSVTDPAEIVQEIMDGLLPDDVVADEDDELLETRNLSAIRSLNGKMTWYLW